MSRPNLYHLDSWRKHQVNVLEVIEGALVDLATAPSLPEWEIGLNRALLFRYREVNRRLLAQGRGVLAPLYYECSGQPIEEQERAAIEGKRPDFNVGLVDTQAGRDRFFYVEGKRLGTALPSGWVLNEEYSKNGVRRFIDPAWAYGEGEDAGAMIGYVQSMDASSIAAEVNGHGATLGCTMISLSSPDWTTKGALRLAQDFSRSVIPSPFHLDHLWADIRHCARQAAPPRKSKSSRTRAAPGPVKRVASKGV